MNKQDLKVADLMSSLELATLIAQNKVTTPLKRFMLLAVVAEIALDMEIFSPEEQKHLLDNGMWFTELCSDMNADDFKFAQNLYRQEEILYIFSAGYRYDENQVRNTIQEALTRWVDSIVANQSENY